jgi:type II secretory pathway component GspD/PulD (secretin)
MRTALFLSLVLLGPLAAAPEPAAGKPDDAIAAARKALDEVGDMSYQNRSLNDVANDLKERAKLTVLIDPLLSQFGIDPNVPIVNVSQKQVKLRDGLKIMLAPYSLRFGFVKEGLFISTEDGLIARQLRQRVTIDSDGTAIANVIRQLAADTGANLVLDPRLKDQAKAPATLKLDDVPLETAVRLLAEVSDLRAVRMNNVLFVTTPERAEKLRADADGPVPVPQNHPIFRGIHPQPFPVIGFGGAIPAAPPLQVLPAPVPKIEAPAEAPPPPPPAKKG